LPDDGGPDVFVHVHDVETAGMKTLVAGQVLVYNTAPARDGRLKAVNLRSLSSHCRRQLFANAAMAASQMKLPAPSTPLSPSRH
jgi:cold shock CspA family protein